MNFADGAYFEKVDGSTNLLKVTMNGVTDELDIGNASTFTAKLCKDSPNVLSASHMFIKNGSNKFYKITKENNNLNIASSTIGNYNKSSYNMTKTITMNNFYPIPIIDHYSSSYNTSFDNIIDGFSDCQDYSDICINDIDDFKEGINIGHGNYDVGNIKYWTDINDDNIFKRENKLGFLLKVRKGEYKENIMQKVNETYYIIWYDEFQISDFEDNVDKIRTFKVDTTNRDKENYPKYDEEYYIFTTDTAFKDSKGISRLELDSNLEKKINGNSNISKLLFSTDSYVENVFPISDYNFYNSAIDINRIKEIIISDINRN